MFIMKIRGKNGKDKKWWIKMRNNTMFMRLHPFVNMLYFLVLIFITMFYQHPVLLSITGITCFIYAVYLGGYSQFKQNIVLLPVLFLFSFINPLFNHRGTHVLFRIGKNPITFESFLYGLIAAGMVYDMILLFSIFHKVMSSDKIICVFSKTLPIGSLLFTMTLRFVPMYKEQLSKMKSAQKGIGFVEGKKRIEKIRNGVEVVSGLLTWAMENALETAQSMKARGFGLKGRTYYSRYHMTRFDWQLIGVMGGGLLVIIVALIRGVYSISYYPIVEWYGFDKLSVLSYVVFFVFAALPIIIDGKEEITWNYLKQKI